ncbi:MAG: hypothetical protein HYZ44_06185 [Bacteroidetes bacterium]|nr:hypothetical protein [Bacteroidota bacterium]
MDPKNLSKQLGDKTLPTKLGDYEFEQKLIDVPAGGDKLQFAFGVEVKPEAFLFNDANDFDPKNPDDVLGPNSLIAFTPGNAWLKYSALAGIKTESGIEVEKLGFNFGGKGSVISTSYRKHGLTETVGSAILNDVTHFKSIFDRDQIKSLEADEAVTFSLKGKLEASVKIKWSDTFSTGLSALGELINQNQLFKIKVGAEAFASYKITVTDDFTAKIICKQKGQYGIYISKSVCTNQVGSVGAKVGAEFEDKADIAKAVGHLVEGYFGMAENEIESLVAKAADAITKKEKEALQAIGEKLGWAEEKFDLVDKLKKEYENLKKKIGEKIEEWATFKVSVAFTYDYNRISTRSTLFEAETNDAGIDRFHLPILKMNADALIQSHQNNEGILSNVKFIKTDVKEVIRSTGFSLGIGKWTAGSTKKITIKTEEQEDQAGYKKISYQGNRYYGEEAFGDGVNWKIDLNAQMSAFSQNKAPFANEFDYGFYVGYEWKENKLNFNECAHFTDLAAIWGIIPAEKIASEAQRLADELKNRRDIKLSCEIKVKAEAFEMILPALAKSSKRQDIIALALGKSMPRWGDYKTRKDIALRTQVYGALWKSYLSKLDTPDENTQLYADEAFNTLRTSDKDLAEAELNFGKGVFKPYSFGSTININKNTYLSAAKLADGFALLTSGNDPRTTLAHNKVIPSAFDSIEDFWRFPHHIKTLGTLLSLVLEGYPSLKQYVDRTASIQYKNEQAKEMVIVLGR